MDRNATSILDQEIVHILRSVSMMMAAIAVLFSAMGRGDRISLGLHTPEIPETVPFDDRLKSAVVRSPDGLFRIAVNVGGDDLQMIVDTGASVSVLTSTDAERIRHRSLPLISNRKIETVNGTIDVKWYRIRQVRIMGQMLENFDYAVAGNALSQSIVGEDALNQLGPVTITPQWMTFATGTANAS